MKIILLRVLLLLLLCVSVCLCEKFFRMNRHIILYLHMKCFDNEIFVVQPSTSCTDIRAR